MLKHLVRRLRRYSEGVPIARRPSATVHALPFPPELQGYEGKWVAVYDHQVVHAADTSIELAAWLTSSGLPMREVTMRFVRPPADAYIVGAG